MRGLAFLPTEKHLLVAYQRLQSPAPLLDEELDLYFLWSQWVRFDPRLGEVWLAKFDQCWKTLPVLRLEKFIGELCWPGVVGVLFQQYEEYWLGPGHSDFQAFRQWKNLGLVGIEPESYQSFFVGLSPFRSSYDEKVSVSPLRSFKRWGFYGDEIFKNKSALGGGKSSLTQISRNGRAEVLKDLLKRMDRIGVNDYLEALEYRVHRRTAELDLKGSDSLEAFGATRARFYRRKRKQS